MPIRILVTRAELAAAMKVWLKIMPKRIWRELEKYEAAAREKRQDPEERPSAEAEIVEHVVAQMERARWEVTKPEPPQNLFSDQAGTGCRPPPPGGR